MKRELKKLALDRQTIRTLTHRDLVHAAGGMMNNTRSCDSGCTGGGGGGTGGSATWGFDCATMTLACLSNVC